MVNRTIMRGLRHVPSVAVAMILSGTAYAADLSLYRTTPLVTPPSAAFDWTGFHIGLIAGYAWDGHDADYSYNNVPSFILPMLPTHADLTSQGASVGGVIGYDQRMGVLVLGAEGDISWMNLRGHGTSLVPGDPSIGFPPLTFETDYKLDWFSTIRGRIGIPLNHLLVYGTGGLALAGVSMNTLIEVGNGSGDLVGSTGDTKVGWTAGGGAEFAITNHFTMKAEALYFDLGSISLTATNPLNPSSLDAVKKVGGVIARAGIGYKF